MSSRPWLTGKEGMMAFRDRIRFFWDGLSPKAKQKVVLFSVIGFVLVVSAAGYWVRSSSPPPPKQAGGKKEEVALDPKLLEKSMYMEGQKEIAKRDEKIAALSKQIDDIINDREKEKGKEVTAIQDEKKALDARGKTGGFNTKGAGKGDERLPDLPLPPPPGSYTGGRQPASYSFAKVPPPPGGGSASPPVPGQTSADAARPETFGEIEIVSARDVRTGKEGKDDGADKKKESGDKIYLPPSFMAATLLSGLDAPTSEGAKGNPAPVFIRIKELAVLPNRVKANLKG